MSLTVVSIAHAGIPASERDVLQAIYTGTDGANWYNNANWNGAAGTECTWYGVYCNVGQTHVTLIQLSADNLTGSLPALDGLTELTGFKAGLNQIGGSIPALDQLSKLEIFDVNRNQLSGMIPSLAGLSLLSDFEVWSNQLDGPLPALAGLTNLGGFYAHNNKLTGSIPNLASLVNLTEFHVYNNKLTGPIPPLAGLVALSEFEVDNNQLTGSIPDLTGVPLTILRVGGNGLTGGLPAAPNTLQPGASSVCVNFFPQSSYSADASWDVATGISPWYTPCNVVFADGFQGP